MAKVKRLTEKRSSARPRRESKFRLSAKNSVKPETQFNDWLEYTCDPSIEGGKLLKGVNGKPLRASRISVFAPYVYWSWNAGATNSIITSPVGDRPTTPRKYAYLGYHRFCIVVSSTGIKMVEGTTADSPTEILLSPRSTIAVDVNGIKGRYAYHVGSFKILVRVDQA
jgi:hypothetical protein